ncbi:hypothetical protein K493DRAFT_297005 [Basidiobolus meristosporus CBS 931.73]|uniref:Yeast cell wall synthesis Kre9/Knh1-like N-terminal domain-containing protein n=1 Tax=Basidiobolus meristosporus CBS 931.73 TaxID=1314790 RepID=A0A1Y1Z3L2_9FUNG|nr:hypothetical protein K493DRAFT_297005 [Basidiobolus meristosporus CBS 931.73]|eukprot:ORY04435.1 hypothetical protein K493DRAFT_297005 [Basidiobolus meristosporus CBS 931.73]
MNPEGRTLLWYLWLTAIGVHAEFSITSPIGASWEIGASNIISWQEIDGQPSPSMIDLHLMQGSPASLQLIANIATAVDTKSGQYAWTIPKNIKPEANYAIQASEGKFVRYSPFFEIIGQSNIEEIDENSELGLSSPTDLETPSLSLAATPTPTRESPQAKAHSSSINKLNASGSSTLLPSKTATLSANATKASRATSKSEGASHSNNSWAILIMAVSSLGLSLLLWP